MKEFGMQGLELFLILFQLQRKEVVRLKGSEHKTAWQLQSALKGSRSETILLSSELRTVLNSERENKNCSFF